VAVVKFPGLSDPGTIVSAYKTHRLLYFLENLVFWHGIYVATARTQHTGNTSHSSSTEPASFQLTFRTRAFHFQFDQPKLFHPIRTGILSKCACTYDINPVALGICGGLMHLLGSFLERIINARKAALPKAAA
jgi:hypothetical protein